MLVILEGTEGAGKTTVAKFLVQAYGLLNYRAFREDNDVRLTTDEVEEWRRLGVYANTYVEELYIADFLRALYRGEQGPRMVMDRAMVSGLVYHVHKRILGQNRGADVWPSDRFCDEMRKELEADWAKEVWNRWVDRILPCRPTFFRLTASVATSAKRHPGDPRTEPKRLKALNAGMDLLCERWASVAPIVTIATDSLSPEQVRDTVIRNLVPFPVLGQPSR